MSVMATEGRNCAEDEFETALVYTMCRETEQWSKEEEKVKLEEQPFEKGGARVCYKAKLLQGGTENTMVAKLFLRKTASRQLYFDEAMTQILAEEYAEDFNTYGVCRRIRFNSISVCKLLERDGQFATLEPILDGKYFKHNDNDGYVIGNDPIPQAFSHFSWEASNHQLLICDIQGVGDTYTDPQIHTVTGKHFGVGNMGPEGIAKFFVTHRCNEVCRALQLPSRRVSKAQKGPNMPSERASKRSQEAPVEVCLQSKNINENTGMLKKRAARTSFAKSLFGAVKRAVAPASPAAASQSASGLRFDRPLLLGAPAAAAESSVRTEPERRRLSMRTGSLPRDVAAALLTSAQPEERQQPRVQRAAGRSDCYPPARGPSLGAVADADSKARDMAFGATGTLRKSGSEPSLRWDLDHHHHQAGR